MSLLRPASIVLLAIACSVPLAAQSASRTPNIAQAAQATQSAPQDNVLHIPGMAKQQLTPQMPPSTSPKILVPPMDMAKELANRSQLAQNDTCFTLRSYGFTPDDLKSADPRPSTTTTCTPASTGKTKQAKAATLVR